MNRRAFLSTAAACSVVSASAQYAAEAQPAERFAMAARYSAERNGATFLVVRNGVILAETYTGVSADTRLPVGEGTRAFTPLLLASLAQDRLLNLDEPVAATLGDWGAHPVKSTISIRVLASGASGIAFDRRDTRDLATAIALEPRESPGTHFVNDEAPYILLAEIARRKLEASGREPDPARYLTQRTLGPIGCTPITWTRAQGGAARFDDGVAVSARGWAQVGELIRREGVWRAAQLADDDVIREALRGSFAESRAGFGLWLGAIARNRNDLNVDTDIWRAQSPVPTDLAMAAGAGAQRLYVVPSAGLVIVRQARAGNTQWSDAQFLSLLWRDL